LYIISILNLGFTTTKRHMSKEFFCFNITENFLDNVGINSFIITCIVTNIMEETTDGAPAKLQIQGRK